MPTIFLWGETRLQWTYVARDQELMKSSKASAFQFTSIPFPFIAHAETKTGVSFQLFRPIRFNRFNPPGLPQAKA